MRCACSESSGGGVGGEQARQRIGQVERDTAIAVAELLAADPHHVAGSHQGVEIAGAVIEHARGQDLALQIGGGQGRALQDFDGVEQGVEAAARNGDAVPAGEQADEGVLFGGYHLAAQAGERLAADLLQHVGVAPFAMHALGTELAFEQFAIGVEAAEDGFDLRRRQAEARRGVGGGERSVSARVAAQEFEQRAVGGFEEDSGEARRQRHADGVAIARGVFHGNEARLAGNAHADGAARGGEFGNRAAGGARLDLFEREIAEAEEEIVQSIGVARLVIGVEGLQLLLDFGEGGFVEQFAEIGAAENFLELRLIDGEGLGAAFGERSVAIVDVVGDVGEEQGGGVGRGLGGIDGGDAYGAALHLLEDGGGGLQIENFADAFAIGFEQHGEARKARGHGQQVGGALALLPERSADAGPAARKQQRAGGGFAEFGGEERGAAELAQDEVLQLGGRGQEPVGFQRFLGFGEADDEAVVAPHGLDFDAALGAQLRGDGHAPGRMHAAAERGEHADAKVAEFVAAALDDDVAIAGHAAGGGGLVFEIAQQVLGGIGVEAVFFHQAREGRGARHGAAVRASSRRSRGRTRRAVRRRRHARRASCRARRARG